MAHGSLCWGGWKNRISWAMGELFAAIGSRQTDRSLVSAVGRFEPVMMMFFLRFDRLVIAQ
jgi:hypothetical protein